MKHPTTPGFLCRWPSKAQKSCQSQPASCWPSHSDFPSDAYQTTTGKKLLPKGSVLGFAGNLFSTDPRASWVTIAYYFPKWRSSLTQFFWYFSASDQVRMPCSLKWPLPVTHIPRVSVLSSGMRRCGGGVYISTCQVFTVYLTGKSTTWLLTSCPVKI